MTLGLIFLFIILDQLTKYYASTALVYGDKVLIENFLRLSYLENRGAAFGILQEKQVLFILVTALVVGVICYYLPKLEKFSWNYWALVLILSGTLGNFIDRIRLGYVIDFISFRFKNYHFAVFNLADAWIVLGSILLCLDILFHEGETEL